MPRSGAAHIENKLLMKFFTWPAGRRESSFEDSRCKVPSVGGVKSAECGMMPVGSGMVPLHAVVANRLLGGLLGLCNFGHSWVLTGPKLTIEFDASIENAKVLL